MKRGLIVPEEKNGVFFEPGPNAILLSDISLQQEQFSNLAEFPVFDRELNRIQGEFLKDIPIVRWKLLPTNKKRMRAAVTTF
jgi:hemerythrin